MKGVPVGYVTAKWITIDSRISQKPVTRSYGIFFDLRLNKRLSKQSWGWWFETSSHSLWRHCNAVSVKQTENIELSKCQLGRHL